MTVPPKIVELVERFRRNLDVYKRDGYKEASVRSEFIEPLFGALGWDVRNVQGYAEQYKEVVHEATLKVGGEVRAPDYSFRIGGVPKFYLEAKKPSVWVKEDIGPAYQLRRYAWSAKLPLSVLTDFEEFAVYDCRQRPNPKDKASVGRVMYLTFDDYPRQWDEIYGILAKESVLKGSFDRYVSETKRKRGTAEVDTEFLKEIEGWRETLARNIALRNPALSVHELNYAVQRTIDRLIFLRMTEDRGIEVYGRLRDLAGAPEIYHRLGDLYRQADEKYNAGLFDLRKDTLTPALTVDDRALKPILSSLYYPQCPYEFSVLPADVLGQVYEQFLGKVIRLTPAHRAVVEEKPEVKKAGGVYYTPTYIVDYIVAQTVGRLVEGKTPRQMARLRILDPACGSGSFLLGAYQYLLDTHLQWYEADDPEKHARGRQPAVYQAPSPIPPQYDGGGQGGGWRLTTAEKKRILLNNIYGVDIDRQAVEVTKLSLLLKVLEGETDETLGQQLALWREPALPDLANNIKCGNSLIGLDYFEAQLLPDEEEVRRVNPFDWGAEFPQVFAPSQPSPAGRGGQSKDTLLRATGEGRGGGFDAVIGNPPYISMLQLDRIQSPSIKPYWKEKYKSAAGAFDIFVLFVEQGIKLTREQGYLSYIIPNKFLAAEYARAFRRWLLENVQFLSLLDFSRVKVWSASVYPVIPVFRKLEFDSNLEITVASASTPSLGDLQPLPSVPANRLGKVPDNIWSFLTQPGAEILLKCLEHSDPLEEIAGVYGSTTVAEGSEYPSLIVNNGAPDHGTDSAKFVVSGSVYRYTTTWFTEPVTFSHKRYTRPLIQLKPPMPDRRIEQSRSAKLLICKVALEPRVFLDTEGRYAGAYVTYVFHKDISLQFLCAVLNSSLMRFLFRALYDALAMGGGYLRFQPPQMRRLPIRTIDFHDPADAARHDKMAALVERMLELHKKLAAASIPDDKTLYQRQIAATDAQIDALVYELYGLTEDEIRIVEEATG